MEKIVNFIKLSVDEMKNKVTWPNYKSLQNSSVLVLVATMIFALLIFGMDKFYEWFLDLIYNLT